MNTHDLAIRIKAKGWSQAALAKRIGVSRQAVSLWFQREQASIRSEHLFKLCAALGVRAEDLVQPLPGFGVEHDQLMAAYLWDMLYPDLDEFALAVNAWQLEAVARLVQVAGLYAAERLLGRKVWQRFGDYQRYLHPVRRQQLEGLVQWHLGQTTT